MDLTLMAIIAVLVVGMVIVAWPRVRGTAGIAPERDNSGRGRGLLQIGSLVASAYTGGATAGVTAATTRRTP